jgi:hypothetical protein
MGMAWMMLFGPAVEHATYVFLAPSLAWAVLHREAWPRGRWLIVSAFVLIAILGWDALTRFLLGNAPLLTTSLPLGSALFTLWLIGYAQSCPLWIRRGLPAPSAVAWQDDNAEVAVLRQPHLEHTSADDRCISIGNLGNGFLGKFQEIFESGQAE